jgi:glycosyltransferase involved in cell wall biosynthesis
MQNVPGVLIRWTLCAPNRIPGVLRGCLESDIGLVSSVEVRTNGGSWQKARITLPPCSTGVGNETAQTAGCRCDFELLLEALPISLSGRVHVEVAVQHLGGQRVEATPQTFQVATGDSSSPPPRQRVPVIGARAPEVNSALASRSAVTLVCHSLQYGGAQLYLALLAKHLPMRTALRPEAVIAPADGPWRGWFESHGLDVHVTGRADFRSLDSLISHRAALRLLLSRLGPELVIVNSASEAVAVLAARDLGIQVIWCIHENFTPLGFIETISPDNPLRQVLLDLTLEALATADLVVFPNRDTETSFTSGAHVRSSVIPLGIDLAEVDAQRSLEVTSARTRVGLPVSGRVLLCLGSIEPRKRQTLVSQAFHLLAPRFPDTTLAFVGARDGSPHVALLKEACADLDGRVVIRTVTSEPYVWYRASSALVCASDIEGMPYVVLEAAAFGLPIVASTTPGVIDALGRRCAYLCEPNDLGSLMGALESLLSADPRKLAARVRRARARIESEHGIVKFVDRFISLVEDLDSSGLQS